MTVVDAVFAVVTFVLGVVIVRLGRRVLREDDKEEAEDNGHDDG